MGFYKITNDARKVLGNPSGILFTGTPDESIPKAIDFIKKHEKEYNLLKNEKYISCVGDVVTHAFFTNSFLEQRILWAFIDGKTQRNETLDIEFRKGYRELSLVNEQGCISDDAILFIKSYNLSDPISIVLVEGEEDLLVIPLTLELPENYLIFYGQPPITSAGKDIPAGLGLIIIDQNMKSLTSSLLSEFERID